MPKPQTQPVYQILAVVMLGLEHPEDAPRDCQHIWEAYHVSWLSDAITLIPWEEEQTELQLDTTVSTSECLTLLATWNVDGVQTRWSCKCTGSLATGLNLSVEDAYEVGSRRQIVYGANPPDTALWLRVHGHLWKVLTEERAMARYNPTAACVAVSAARSPADTSPED